VQVGESLGRPRVEGNRWDTSYKGAHCRVPEAKSGGSERTEAAVSATPQRGRRAQRSRRLREDDARKEDVATAARPRWDDVRAGVADGARETMRRLSAPVGSGAHRRRGCERESGDSLSARFKGGAHTEAGGRERTSPRRRQRRESGEEGRRAATCCEEQTTTASKLSELKEGGGACSKSTRRPHRISHRRGGKRWRVLHYAAKLHRAHDDRIEARDKEGGGGVRCEEHPTTALIENTWRGKKEGGGAWLSTRRPRHPAAFGYCRPAHAER
jgi:hypothetical protein